MQLRRLRAGKGHRQSRPARRRCSIAWRERPTRAVAPSFRKRAGNRAARPGLPGRPAHRLATAAERTRPRFADGRRVSQHAGQRGAAKPAFDAAVSTPRSTMWSRTSAAVLGAENNKPVCSCLTSPRAIRWSSLRILSDEDVEKLLTSKLELTMDNLRAHRKTVAQTPCAAGARTAGPRQRLERQQTDHRHHRHGLPSSRPGIRIGRLLASA